jgi:hypothetical protein
VFIKTYQDLLGCGLWTANPQILNSGIVSCADIGYRTVKDTAGIFFFDITLYKDIEDYNKYYGRNMQEEVCMHIYIGSSQWNDSINIVPFSCYIEIPEFYNGDVWIDVSKNTANDPVLLSCGEWLLTECRDCMEEKNLNYNRDEFHTLAVCTVPILNITPTKYEEPPLIIKERVKRDAITRAKVFEQRRLNDYENNND